MKKEGEKKEERGERERGRERDIRGTQFLGGSRKKSVLPKKIQTQRRGRIGLYLYMWGYGF